MQYELEIITDISITRGKSKRILKDEKVRKIFDLSNIELEEYVDPKTGKRINKYSAIYQNSIYYKINKPYEELKSLVLNRTAPVLGFMSKSNYYRNGQEKTYKSRRRGN